MVMWLPCYTIYNVDVYLPWPKCRALNSYVCASLCSRLSQSKCHNVSSYRLIHRPASLETEKKRTGGGGGVEFVSESTIISKQRSESKTVKPLYINYIYSLRDNRKTDESVVRYQPCTGLWRSNVCFFH